MLHYLKMKNVVDIFIFHRGDIPKGDDILEQEDIVKLKRCIYSAQVLAFSLCHTVKHVLRQPLKRRQQIGFSRTDNSLMQFKSIAECSFCSIAILSTCRKVAPFI